MTNEEAKHKLDFMKKAYQKLIDEKVDSGKLVGDGVRGEWQAKTPLDEAYKDMIEGLDLAIKALEQQLRDCKTCKHSDNGNCAGSEECHECMWESKYEQQPSEPRTNLAETSQDCISRAELIQKLNAWDSKVHGIPNYAWKVIRELPPVTPQQPAWIPVSERLPEDNIHVLCQFYLGGMGECYLAHGAFHVVGGLVMTCNEVIAWMPLPEPYEAESEE